MDYSRITGWIATAEARVRQFAANLVQWTDYQRSTAKGEEDGASGWPTTEARTATRTTRRMQHYGFRSLPPKGTRAVMLLVGGSGAQAVTVAEDEQNLGPTAMSEGDVAVYSKATGTVIKISAAGEITIDAAAGQDVIVNGGTLKVARDTDPVTVTGGSYTPTSLTLQVKDGAGTSGTLAITVAAGALVVTPAGVLPTSTFTLAGTISDGAANFKG